jgi:hypothetical protein
MLKGIELDLSALYFKGELIHFSYSEIEKASSNRFGPSSVRLYRPLCYVEEQMFLELTHIGKALGAHGFANISCMQSEGNRFYFEADMRANAWVNTPRFFGEDPAIRIKNWLIRGERLHCPAPHLPNQPFSIRIPYFLRLKWTEVLFNRYRVWKYIPSDDKKLMARLLLRKLYHSAIRENTIRAAKYLIPKRYHKKMKHVMQSLVG